MMRIGLRIFSALALASGTVAAALFITYKLPYGNTMDRFIFCGLTALAWGELLLITIGIWQDTDGR